MTGALPSATKRLHQSRTRCIREHALARERTIDRRRSRRSRARLRRRPVRDDGRQRRHDPLARSALRPTRGRLPAAGDSGAVAQPRSRTRSPRIARKQGRAVVKLIVTRGPGTRGYLPPGAGRHRRACSRSRRGPSIPAPTIANGISVRVCQLRLGGESGARRPQAPEPPRASARAARAARPTPCRQGLLLDTSGHVVGGTSSNLFAVRRPSSTTPTLARCGIKGVMRRAVLETAPNARHARRRDAI